MLFLKRFGPATIGSAGTQIALFADTIIASFLATGALSALYYADRLNQLPIGVIGIAAGTVLLPEMARRITAGDEAGARHSQNRAIELTLLLSVPCVVAFLLVPELIMRALFGRGAFTAADAQAAGATLMAYAIGLLPFVLMRSATVTFLSRGDTATPVKALFVAVAVNVALKILLMDRYAQVGLAFATSVGAWINLALLRLVRRAPESDHHRSAPAAIERQARRRRRRRSPLALVGLRSGRSRTCSRAGRRCATRRRCSSSPSSASGRYGGAGGDAVRPAMAGDVSQRAAGRDRDRADDGLDQSAGCKFIDVIDQRR